MLKNNLIFFLVFIVLKLTLPIELVEFKIIFKTIKKLYFENN